MSRSGRTRRTPQPAVDTGVGRAEVVVDHRVPSARMLLIDGQVHGHVDPADPTRLHLDYQHRLAAIIRAVVPSSGDGDVLHLGGGAFAVPRAIGVTHPTMRQMVVERSAAIIRLAERELGLRRSETLVVRKADARTHVERMPSGSVDVVAGDAFVDGHTPRQLTTVEWMAQVARVLSPGGTYVVNLIDEPPWGVLGAHAAAARTAFPDVVALGSRGVARLRDPGNVFLLAGAAIDRQRLTQGLAGGPHPGALVAAGQLQVLADRHRARHDADG